MTLIAYLWGFMLLVTLLAAVAGWSWAEARARPRWRVMEEERRTLRAELLGLAAGGPVAEGNGNGESNVAARRRIADLEQALAEARGRAVEVEVLRLRIAELERAGAASPRNVAAIDVTEYTSRIAALEAQLAQARDHIMNHGNLPGRIEALEGDLSATRAALAAAPPPEDKNRIFRLEQELEAARGEVAATEALAARVKELEAAPPSISEDERNLLEWRNRYLGERVRYLETQTPAIAVAEPEPEPAPEPVDTAAAQERADRRAWRARYFEQRALHLEAERAAAPEAPPPVDDAPLKARIAELETQIVAATATAGRVPALEGEIVTLKASAARVPELETQVAATAEIEHDTVRTKWKARYLEARVRYLEDKLNAAPAPVAPSAPTPAPVEKIVVAPPPTPAPEPARVFRLERPAALSAPRNGAPDDLRLIDGVNPQAQATLNAIGVFHFEQIAHWSPAHVAWVDQYLNLRGRIVSEHWVEQAGKLALGVPA